ncbi:MAG: DEAD/DEAH box helicase family protein [Leptospiraceae bacterium]|nr:DEAD/DEAH box helicase family protein [Leptospiraceae bacterium]
MSNDLTPILLDNQSDERKLSNFLNRSVFPSIQEIYIATGYFYLSGFGVVHPNLLSNPKVLDKSPDLIRMIISPKTDKITRDVLDNALSDENEKAKLIQSIIQDFENSLEETTLSSAEGLVNLLKSKTMSIRLFLKDFFHAKAYIAKVNHGGFAHTYTIVGSSNFTLNGLSNNRELNMLQEGTIYFDKYKEWFLQLWDNETIPLDSTLLQVVEESIRKAKENQSTVVDAEVFLTPLQMLLYIVKYFLGILSDEDLQVNDQLVEFQRIGAENVMNKLEKLDGAIISDSVGLGKTFTAGEVIKRYIKNNKRVLVITPPNTVLEQWRETLKKYFGIVDGGLLTLYSQGKFSQLENSEVKEIFTKKIDLIVLDEAHRARNKESKLYHNLNSLHPHGERAKVLLLTATPYNNRISDLENLVRLCTTETKLTNAGLTPKSFSDMEEFSKKLFAGTPLSEIEKEEKYTKSKGLVKNILNAVMLLRMRTTIREKYGKITIAGKPLVFEDPIVKRINYTYSDEFQTLFQELPNFLSQLELPHIRISKPGNSGFALGSLYKLFLFKLIESSLYAFNMSIERIVTKNLELKERILKDGFARVVKESQPDIEESMFSEMEIEEEENQTANEDYTEEDVLRWIESDLLLIQNFIDTHIKPHRKETNNPITIHDPKIDKILEILKEPGYKKALVFTTYKDTIFYLNHKLNEEKNAGNFPLAFETATGEDKTSNSLEKKLDRFAPKARGINTENSDFQEINVLFSTDVLSEGVNLQDADLLINFDLPWNPMRIVQRIGRVNRIGSENKVKVVNLSPDSTLDQFLNLIKILETKVTMVATLLGKEMAILSSDKETIHAEDIGEEIKKRENISSISDYERISASNSFFGDLEGETDEDYFRSYLFFSSQENKIRKKDFLEIAQFKSKKVYYTILNQNPKTSYTFYEVYGKRGDYKDLLSRICLKAEYGLDKKIEVTQNYPFHLFTKENMSKSGFAKFELQDIEKFRELERHSKETFNNLLESRAKQYSLASLNQRSKKIKGGQTILYTQIANLLQKNEQELIGESFREVLEKKNCIREIEELLTILALYQLPMIKLKELEGTLKKAGIVWEKQISKPLYALFAEELLRFYNTTILADPNLRGVLYRKEEIFGEKILCLAI